jgi:hypothetical protein
MINIENLDKKESSFDLSEKDLELIYGGGTTKLSQKVIDQIADFYRNKPSEPSMSVPSFPGIHPIIIDPKDLIKTF